MPTEQELTVKSVSTINSRMSRLWWRLLGRWLVTVLLCWLPLGLAFAQGVPGGGFSGPGPGQGPKPPAADDAPRSRVPYYGPASSVPVTELRIVGNQLLPEARIQSMLQTRKGRTYDPELVQQDVRTLIGSGMFEDVRHYWQEVPGGMQVTFQVIERPTVGHVRFLGNDKIKEKTLLKESRIKVGDPLNRYRVDESRRAIEQYYLGKGYGKAVVTVVEGLNPHDQGVAFQIHEGPKQRIKAVYFEGNSPSIATDGRLKTQIESKRPRFLFWTNKVNEEAIDDDVDRIKAYYRALGFFRSRVSRQLEYDDDFEWLTIRFVIDEGPRYRIRSIRYEGVEKYDTKSLDDMMKLKTGDYFSLAYLQQDLTSLKDLYGSEGHIFANIESEPVFAEQPGVMDLVYKVDEGDQWRVGRINVIVEGENPHTRRSAVLNRISLRPGDVIDIREIRASERRLKSSQIFAVNPAQGIEPRIVVKPPEQNDTEMARKSADQTTYRGQSPDEPRQTSHFRGPHLRYVDLNVTIDANTNDTKITSADSSQPQQHDVIDSTKRTQDKMPTATTVSVPWQTPANEAQP
ncbi:MAG: POTRA domain-containing protein [Pirellulaceae bacterium]|nr:hypothetical protein [Planctomycetales bacterium]